MRIRCVFKHSMFISRVKSKVGSDSCSRYHKECSQSKRSLSEIDTGIGCIGEKLLRRWPTHISMSKHCTLDLASSTSHLFLFGPASDNLIEGQMNPSLASKKSGWLLRPATSPPQAMSLATSLSHHQQQQLGGNRAEASPRLLSGESNHTKL